MKLLVVTNEAITARSQLEALCGCAEALGQWLVHCDTWGLFPGVDQAVAYMHWSYYWLMVAIAHLAQVAGPALRMEEMVAERKRRE